MQTEHSPNGLNNLPIDSIVVTYGFGASPVNAQILSAQRADGTYSVCKFGDGSNTNRIHADDIESVIFLGGAQE